MLRGKIPIKNICLYLKEMDAFVNTDFSDCPKMTKEELSQFRPWYELHPDFGKEEKKE